MVQKFPVIPTISCLVAVCILGSLGFWQIQRLEWKNNLQQSLDTAFSKEDPNALNKEDLSDLKRTQIIRGQLKGRADFKNSIVHYGRIENGQSIVSIIVPAQSTISEKIIPVEVGCAHNIDSLDDIKKIGLKEISVTGIIREPRWSFATPPNTPNEGEWWRLDSKELSNYWEMGDVLPIIMTAENTDDLSSFLTPCPIEKTLRNSHLSYAIFWLIMAGVLSIMWGLRFLKPYLQSA